MTVGMENADGARRLRAALARATAEMDRLLGRGSSSPSVAHLGWRASGLYDAHDGHLIHSGQEAEPFLAEVAAGAIGTLLAQLRARGDPPRPGDLFLTNNPLEGGGSLEDVIMAAPALAGGALAGFLAAAVSQPAFSMGRIEPGRTLRDEGLIVPWARVGREGDLFPGVTAVLTANAVGAGGIDQELRLQAHVLATGLEGLRPALEALGPAGVRDAAAAFGATGRDGLRRVLASVPEGRHAAQGAPLPVTLSVAGGRIHLDFTGAAEAAATLGAATPGMAAAACRVAIRQLFSPEVPTLGFGGGWDSEVLDLAAPWCAASLDVAMATGRQHLVHAILESVTAAFAPFYPHLGKAPGPLAPALLQVRGRDGAGRPYALRFLVGGGAGGSVMGDGLAHTGPLAGAGRMPPLERVEERYPILVHAFRLREGSAGPGRYRGGPGAVLDLELRAGEAELNAVLPGMAPGMRGGYAGARARLTVQGQDRGLQAWDGPGRHVIPLRAGGRVRVETPGGGGWGLPCQRPIHKVEDDVRRGLLGVQEAKNPYGVIFDPATLVKDDVLTYRVRHYLLTSLVVEDIVAGQDATIWG